MFGQRTQILAGAALLSLFVIGVKQAQGGKKSDAEVKVTAVAAKADSAGKQVVTVTLLHNKGWHTYANPVGNEDFEGNKVEINIKAKVKPTSVKVEYPVGKVHMDKVVGDYKIYEDKVQIPVTIVRAEGDMSPLEISVRLQACHDKGVCLLPATVKVTVP